MMIKGNKNVDEAEGKLQSSSRFVTTAVYDDDDYNNDDGDKSEIAAEHNDANDDVDNNHVHKEGELATSSYVDDVDDDEIDANVNDFFQVDDVNNEDALVTSTHFITVNDENDYDNTYNYD